MRCLIILLQLSALLGFFIPTMAQATTCTNTFFTSLMFEPSVTTLRKEEREKLVALSAQLTHPNIDLEVVIISAETKTSTLPAEAKRQNERVESLKRLLLSSGLSASKLHAVVSVETKGFERNFDELHVEAIGLNNRCMELMRQGKLKP